MKIGYIIILKIIFLINIRHCGFRVNYYYKMLMHITMTGVYYTNIIIFQLPFINFTTENVFESKNTRQASNRITTTINIICYLLIINFVQLKSIA